MKYSEAKMGRVFVVRLEDGDILHESLERFARERGIQAGAVIVLGGADVGSKLVVGPEHGRSQPVVPMELILDDVHEVAGVGTIFPDSDGRPILHLHMACGRKADTRTGCVRRGVRVWQVVEAVVWELTDTSARRMPDAATGFELLEP
jgi:predicted DNA-binding protein with PD1-like motif